MKPADHHVHATVRRGAKIANATHLTSEPDQQFSRQSRLTVRALLRLGLCPPAVDQTIQHGNGAARCAVGCYVLSTAAASTCINRRADRPASMYAPVFIVGPLHSSTRASDRADEARRKIKSGVDDQVRADGKPRLHEKNIEHHNLYRPTTII